MIIGIDGRPLQEKNGGVKEYTLNLLHALFCLDTKNEYHIFYNSSKSINVPDFNQYSNVKTHRFHWPNKLLNLSLYFFKYPKINKLLKIGPPAGGWKLEIFWMPNLNFAAFSAGQKFIATIHDLSFHHFPYFYSLKQQIWHKALNYKKLLFLATKIITVSQHSKNDLRETFGLPPEKIEVVYPCLNQNVTRYGSRVTGYEPYILYLGTLEPRKNIEGLVEAYKILRKNPPQSPFLKGGGKEDFPKLVIAGPKGWRYKNIFKAANLVKTPHPNPLPQGERKDKGDGIIFLNHVSEEEKTSLYQNAKLFVFPSFYEGFGLPPLEAASFGVPIIAANNSSLPEVLGDAALYVNAWNVNELAQAMEFLLTNENERQRLSLAAKAQAAKFQAQQSAEKLLNIFEEVAKT